MSDIGMEIRKKRKEMGLTQHEIAGDYMSIAKLSNIENGKILPDPKTWEYLKEKLNLTDEFIEKKEMIEEVHYTLEQAETYYKTGIIEKAKKRYEEVIDLAPKLLQYDRYAEALKHLGIIHLDMKEFKKAETLLIKSREVYMQEEHHQGVIECYMKLGVLYNRQERYNQSLECFQFALESIEEENLRNDSRKGIIYYSIAHNYYYLGNNDQSSFYCDQALKYLSENEVDRIISSLMLQGILLNSSSMTLLAREKLNEAKRLAFKHERKADLARCWHNLAFIEMKHNNFKKAEEQFQLSLEIKEKINDSKGRIRTKAFLTELYQKMNRLDEALEQGQKALKMAREQSLKSEEIVCLEYLMKAYQSVGEEDKMLDATYKAILLSDELNMETKKIDFYDFLAEYYHKIGDEQRAKDHCYKVLLLKMELERRDP